MKRIKLLILVAIWLLCPSQIKAQSNDTLAMQWSLIDSSLGFNYYTGTFRTVNILSNSAIVATLTDSNNIFRLHKYSSTGSLVKTKAYTAGYGGSNLSAKDNNDNIYLTGSFNHINTTIPNISILKYDKALKLKWERNIINNNFGIYYGGISKIHLDANNNLFALGTVVDSVTAPITKKLYFIKKYDSLGNLLLTISISKDTFLLNDFTTGVNNEIYICGTFKDNNNKNTFCYLKYNAAGVFQFVKTYANTTIYKNDVAFKIRVDQLGNVLVYGTITKNLQTSSVSGNQFYLIKYTPSGTKLWHATYRDTDSEYMDTGELEIDNFNNIYISIYYENDGGGWEVIIKKFNTDGIKVWEKYTYQGIDTKLMFSNNGQLFYTSANDLDFSYSSRLHQTDSAGQHLLNYNLRYFGTNHDEVYIRDFDLNKSNNDVILGGQIISGVQETAFPILIKFAIPTLKESSNLLVHNISIYPNPASSFINVNTEEQIQKIEFFNSTGVLVKTILDYTDDPIDIGSFASGLYLVKVTTPSFTKTQRIIKL